MKKYTKKGKVLNKTLAKKVGEMHVKKQTFWSKVTGGRMY